MTNKRETKQIRREHELAKSKLRIKAQPKYNHMGERFGMLTVLGRGAFNWSKVLCRCDCGREVEKYPHVLRGAKNAPYCRSAEHTAEIHAARPREERKPRQAKPLPEPADEFVVHSYKDRAGVEWWFYSWRTAYNRHQSYDAYPSRAVAYAELRKWLNKRGV